MTPGTVYLVGAGPGDPGLLTLRAAELIARADVILHDRLVPAEALAGARPDAELLYVGKQGGGEQVPQAETQRLMLDHARAGRTVVRLKGGDPFVFGRGGEEALACLEAGIPFEVVPGVTAGVAAPAYAGIPVTHRGLASGVAFITGHERGEAGEERGGEERGGGEQAGDERSEAGEERGGADETQAGEERGGADETQAGEERGGGDETQAGEEQAGEEQTGDEQTGDERSEAGLQAGGEGSGPDGKRSEAGAQPDSALDWPALAAFPGTLVFYMGVRSLPRIAEQLIAGGRPADEPVAVVERGTLPGQRTLLATLADVAERAVAERIRAPAITLVGPVAALRERLAWLERRPLHGRTVAVTRARPQASALAARLRELGAAVVEAPVIRTRALDAELPDLAGYDLVCVTSPNGAHALFERLGRAGLDARALAGRTVAAIGPGTASALAEHGITADLVPERAVAESLVERLAAVEVRRALLVRAREGRDVLPDALRSRGAEVDVVALYETVAEPLDEATARAAATADYVTFTSASTVRFFLAAAGALDGPRIASIGPATSAALREAGLEPDLEADPHTPDGLVAALLDDARRRV